MIHAVTSEPVGFEKQPFEVQDFMTIIHCFRQIYEIYLKSRKKNQRMPACITLFISITMVRGIDNIIQNIPYIQFE